MSARGNRKDLAAGLFFITIGAFYGIVALKSLPMGAALNMGPGYFPVLLSAVVAGLGAVIAVRSFFTPGGAPFGVVAVRAILLISLAIVIFALFLRQLGLFPAVFVSSFVACLAKPPVRIERALATAFAIAVFCTAVFSYGIGLNVPVLGRWFGG